MCIWNTKLYQPAKSGAAFHSSLIDTIAELLTTVCKDVETEPHLLSVPKHSSYIVEQIYRMVQDWTSERDRSGRRCTRHSQV